MTRFLLALQHVSAVVSVRDSTLHPNGVRVSVFAIPIYDDGWAGVRRRRARRSARRDARTQRY